jgi:hypothetical protein
MCIYQEHAGIHVFSLIFTEIRIYPDMLMENTSIYYANKVMKYLDGKTTIALIINQSIATQSYLFLTLT